MKNITLHFVDEKQKLEEIETKYLFSYLFRLDNLKKLDLSKRKNVDFSGSLLNDFRDLVNTALLDLINECYEEPTIKKRQKHPTFFEKVLLNNKKYVVDYTTSKLGRLIYTLYIRLLFIDKAIESGGTLNLTYEDDC